MAILRPFLLFFFACQFAVAATESSLSVTVAKSASHRLTSQDRRETKSNFAYLNFNNQLPRVGAGAGVVIGWQQNSHLSWEFEYITGTHEIPVFVQGQKQSGTAFNASEHAISIMGRDFFHFNSFNLSYGFGFHEYRLEATTYYSELTGFHAPGENFHQHSLNAIVGIGNRWSFGYNTSLGIDWLTLTIPLVPLSSPNSWARHEATNVGGRHFDSLFVTASVLKFNFGFMW